MEKLDFNPEETVKYLSAFHTSVVAAVVAGELKKSDLGELAIHSIATRVKLENVLQGDYLPEDKKKAEVAMNAVRDLEVGIVNLYKFCNLSQSKPSRRFRVFIPRKSYSGFSYPYTTFHLINCV